MTKVIYVVAALALTFASADAGSRRTATAGTTDRIQVIYREQASGEWQMFVFGAVCADPKNVQVVFPKDTTQPIEIECDETGDAAEAVSQAKAVRR